MAAAHLKLLVRRDAEIRAEHALHLDQIPAAGRPAVSVAAAAAAADRPTRCFRLCREWMGRALTDVRTQGKGGCAPRISEVRGPPRRTPRRGLLPRSAASMRRSATRCGAVRRAELGRMGRAGNAACACVSTRDAGGAERNVLVLPYPPIAHTLRTVRCARCMDGARRVRACVRASWEEDWRA